MVRASVKRETGIVQTPGQKHQNLIESGVKEILVSSPHCYHTSETSMPKLSYISTVVHISQYLFQLIKEGRIKPSKEYKKKVTYHDPCYLEPITAYMKNREKS